MAAVASEGRSSQPVRRGASAEAGESSLQPHSGGDDDSGAEGESSRRRKAAKKRARAEREDDDVVSKALARRVSKARRAGGARSAGAGADTGGVSAELGGAASVAEVVSYGGAGKLQAGAAELVAKELVDEEQRRARAQRPPGADDDADDIGFINEHNRRFNKVVDKMYGKHEAVQEIKDNLERGTALN